MHGIWVITVSLVLTISMAKAYLICLLLLHQDDIMMATLTVHENFHFSASLRLRSSMTSRERKERVEKVIDELGLTKCADTRVWGSLSLSLKIMHVLVINWISMYVDWEWVSSWSIWWREEEDQYWNGTDHRAPGAVSWWAYHWTGCQHCCFCDMATQIVS